MRVLKLSAVLSGKGGVGKSSVSVQLALSLAANNPTARIGILDIDLTGPSLPRMLGVADGDVMMGNDGWVPVKIPGSGMIQAMSIGFLLKNSHDSVVWRGPKKTAMVRQFLSEVHWGKLDYLIIDTPPGTSDEHISLIEALASVRNDKLSSVLVTTPQAVSISDVAKELSFARKTSLPVLGLIENMSGYVCPHCAEVTSLFGKGGGEDFCRREEEKKANGEGEGCVFLGRMPVDRDVVTLFEGHSSGEHKTLAEQYSSTACAPLMRQIVEKIMARL